MSSVEKISIALPPELIAFVREAVATGEYASSSEVIRDALSDWSQKRQLHLGHVERLQQLWQQARMSQAPGLPVDDVMERLQSKYRVRPNVSDAT